MYAMYNIGICINAATVAQIKLVLKQSSYC